MPARPSTRTVGAAVTSAVVEMLANVPARLASAFSPTISGVRAPVRQRPPLTPRPRSGSFCDRRRSIWRSDDTPDRITPTRSAWITLANSLGMRCKTIGTISTRRTIQQRYDRILDFPRSPFAATPTPRRPDAARPALIWTNAFVFILLSLCGAVHGLAAGRAVRPAGPSTPI